jgi:hypothetical protein
MGLEIQFVGSVRRALDKSAFCNITLLSHIFLRELPFQPKGKTTKNFL